MGTLKRKLAPAEFVYWVLHFIFSQDVTEHYCRSTGLGVDQLSYDSGQVVRRFEPVVKVGADPLDVVVQVVAVL